MKHINNVQQSAIKYLATALLFLGMSVSANAASLGTYQGTFSGNDSVTSLLMDLGLTATSLDRINTPATSTSEFSIFNTVLDDDEIITGDWAYTGTDIVTHIVIKAGPGYAVYAYSDGLNMGSFTNDGMPGKGVSHLTAYSVQPVPIPGALWLMTGSLVALVRLRKKQ